MSMLAFTMIGETQFGRMWHEHDAQRPVPTARAAST